MQECVRLMRSVFSGLADGSASNQPRRRLAGPSGALLHQLAGRYGHYFGAKIYSTHVKHGAWFLVLLYDSETGRPLALMEANALGQIRTGAATGFATDVLARPDAGVLAVIGSGFQARTQVEAIAAVRALREVLVFSRKPERREAFAAELERDLGLAARAVASAEEAVRPASLIVTATFAKDPVFDADWIQDGAHINAIGSNQPTRREIPGEILQRAARVAVDSIEQCRMEAGDLLLGLHDWSRVSELAGFASWPDRDPAAVTVFKSVGLGVQDIAAAAWVYERAVQKGMGVRTALFADLP